MIPPMNAGDSQRRQGSAPHIGIVANHILSLYQFRRALIHRLIGEGYRVTVLAPPDRFAYLLVRDGIPFIPLPIQPYGTDPFKDLAATWRLRRTYLDLGFDLVFHYTAKPNIFGTLAAGTAGIPSISVVTGTGMLFAGRRNLLRTVMELGYRLAIPFAREIWFLNTRDRDDFLNRRMVRKAHCRLLPGEGVDTDFYRPVPPGRESRGPVFLFVGRLIREKGLHDFVDAARDIRRQRPDAVFRILGFVEPEHPSAVFPEEIRTWIEDGTVEYLGGTTDVRPHISRSDAVVLPSWFREGLNRSLLEAASMAKPIITTDMPGCREVVVDGRTGFLFPPRDRVALRRAIHRFLTLDAADREVMGQLGRKRVIDCFHQDRVHEIYLDTIRRLLSLPPKRTGASEHTLMPTGSGTVIHRTEDHLASSGKA